jgi:hypothetical protein
MRQTDDSPLIRFDQGGRAGLIGLFGEMILGMIDIGTTPDVCVIEREKLERSILEKLCREAEQRYRDIRALLRAGVPRTQIRGGHLSAKVLLEESRGGAVMARLATTEGAKGSDVISTLTIDFAVGVFPPFE